jgi:type IV secretion system protein VirB10
MDGYVDNHWGYRLGAALLLSTWSDALQALADSQQSMNGSNNNVTYDTSSRTAEDMASEALKQYINIPPTLYKNQGDPLRVFVARDLDFKNVYELTLAHKISK